MKLKLHHYLFAIVGVGALAAATFTLTANPGSGASQLALPTWSAPALPDSPAGRQVGKYLEAFNSGDEERLSKFIAEHFTPVGPGGSNLSERTRSQLRLYKSSRGLNVYQVDSSSDDSVTLTAQFRLTQEWRQMTFSTSGAPAHLISAVKIVPVDAPVISHTKPHSEQELAQQLEQYMENLVAADQFSGVVLVAKDGVPLFEKAYATADQESKTPNELSTLFSYASVGKMFTAVAIAQLVQAGKLSYDEPFARFLPEYPSEVANKVTIDQLLTHHSGIVDFFADKTRFKEVMASSNPQRDYLPLFMNEPLQFNPGERFEYSNSNYILLGLIIERISGLTFADYLKERVFAPADMTHTGLADSEMKSDKQQIIAKNYTQMDEQEQFVPGTRQLFTGMTMPTGSAAGGGYTTVGDLLKFDRALRTHKLLTPAATEQLLLDRVDYPRPGYRYGYGFITRHSGPERIVGHSGGFPGVDAQFDMYLDSGFTVAILANYELVAEPIIMHIQQLLRH